MTTRRNFLSVLALSATPSVECAYGGCLSFPRRRTRCCSCRTSANKPTCECDVGVHAVDRLIRVPKVNGRFRMVWNNVWSSMGCEFWEATLDVSRDPDGDYYIEAWYEGFRNTTNFSRMFKIEFRFLDRNNRIIEFDSDSGGDNLWPLWGVCITGGGQRFDVGPVRQYVYSGQISRHWSRIAYMEAVRAHVPRTC